MARILAGPWPSSKTNNNIEDGRVKLFCLLAAVSTGHNQMHLLPFDSCQRIWGQAHRRLAV